MSLLQEQAESLRDKEQAREEEMAMALEIVSEAERILEFAMNDELRDSAPFAKEDALVLALCGSIAVVDVVGL